MSNLKLVVFLSSVREARNADRVWKLVSKLATEKGFDVEILDPININLPIIENPLYFYPDQSKAPQELHDLNKKVLSADAYLFITAEYNYGVPPALLNLIDYVPPPSYSFKPAGIISYSIGNGGKFVISHLTDTLVYLGCLIQPFTIAIPTVHNAISENGEAVEPHIEKNIKLLLDQIEFTGLALKNQKQSGKVKQPRLNSIF